MLLADSPEIDSRLWIYLIFAALSVAGGLLGKKKKESDAAQRRQPGGARAGRRSAPTSQRPAQAPHPPRPARPAPPAEARQTPAPAAPGRPARAPRPQPAPARPSPIAARPSQLAQQLGGILGKLEESGLLPAEVVAEARAAEARAAEQHTSLAADTLTPRAAAEPPAPRPSTETEQVRRLLRSRPGLRAGFILHEILAPPVALRDNRPV